LVLKKTLIVVLLAMVWIPGIIAWHSFFANKPKEAKNADPEVFSYHPKWEICPEFGVASWYGPGFHGKRRADGKRFNMNQISVAHKYLPLGTEIKITNLINRKTIRAKVNDRGPYIRGREIDLSYAAAKQLGAVKPGLIPVRIRIMS
jgi:rare lipoprotein A (peptidoglycan hydrolase)